MEGLTALHALHVRDEMIITWQEFTSKPIEHPISREMFYYIFQKTEPEAAAIIQETSKSLRNEKIRRLRLKSVFAYFFLVTPLLGYLAIVLEDVKGLSFFSGLFMIVAACSGLAFIPYLIGTTLTVVNAFNLAHQFEAQMEALFKNVWSYDGYDHYFSFESREQRN